jgi:hypothetical protein
MTQDSKTPMPQAARHTADGPTASGRRYLAQLMEHAFREGWRTPDDFIKRFPSDVIMTALKPAPELRVAILAAATGIYEEILRRKTPALAAEDLRLALEEGTTNSTQLLSVFTPEDRVRYLDPHEIWAFLAEDRFWDLDSDASDQLRTSAVERMTFTLSQALQERLITLRDILDGLTYEAVADSLSPDELRKVVCHALIKGRDGIGLNEKVLLEVLPLDKIVRSVPLDHTWREVVIRRLAVPSGLTDFAREEQRGGHSPRQAEPPPPPPPSSGDASRRESSLSEPARWSSRPPALPEALRAALSNAALANNGPNSMANTLPSRAMSATGVYPESSASREEDYSIREYSEDDDALTALPPSVLGQPASSQPANNRPPLPVSSLPPPPLQSPGPLTDDFNQPLPMVLQRPPSRPFNMPPAADTADLNERQRQRVTEHLRAIGRLPPRHQTMPASVLRSIDAMYALLPSATDDIQRKSVIRQAFASENYLRAALLGLIELMDSSVDTSDPVIQEAKIEALIKILLFEEQRRKETGRFPSGSFNGPRSSSAPSSLPPSSSPGSVRYGAPYAAAYEAPYEPPYAAPYDPRYDAPRYDPYAAPEYAQQSYGVQSSGQPFDYGPGREGAPGQHLATPRPAAPVLSGGPGYPGAPLPNLPAEPSSRRRTMPPPLPPSYPRG